MSLPISTPIFSSQLIYNSTIIKTAVTRTTSHALTSSGKIYSWGSSSFSVSNDLVALTWNSLGTGLLRTSIPTLVNIYGETAIDLCAGYAHVAVLTKSNKVYYWGSITDDSGTSNIISSSTPTSLSLTSLGFNTPKNIYCGSSTIFVVDNSSLVYAVGRNAEGDLGLGNTIDSSSLIKLSYFTGTPAIKMISGSFHTILVLRTDGSLVTWGSNTNGQIGDNNVSPNP